MTPWAGGQNKHGVAPPACLRCSTSRRFPRGTSFGRNASVKTLTAKNHKWRRHLGKRWQNQYPGATRGADGIPPVPDQYDPVQGKGAVAFYTGERWQRNLADGARRCVGLVNQSQDGESAGRLIYPKAVMPRVSTSPIGGHFC